MNELYLTPDEEDTDADDSDDGDDLGYSYDKLSKDPPPDAEKRNSD